MAFIDDIMARAKADKKTIVLPESMDKRTFEAAEKILKAEMANLIIIGTPDEIAKNSEGFDITGATIVDPYNDPNKQKYIDKFVELRGVDTMVAAAKKKAEKKGLSEEETAALIADAQKKGITPEIECCQPSVLRLQAKATSMVLSPFRPFRLRSTRTAPLPLSTSLSISPPLRFLHKMVPCR